MKVSLLLAMPAAAGLFHRAIVQSGPWLKAVSRENATKYAKAFLDALGVKPGELAKLRDASRRRRSRPPPPKSAPPNADRRLQPLRRRHRPAAAIRSTPMRRRSPPTCR